MEFIFPGGARPKHNAPFSCSRKGGVGGCSVAYRGPLRARGYAPITISVVCTPCSSMSLTACTASSAATLVA